MPNDHSADLTSDAKLAADEKQNLMRARNQVLLRLIDEVKKEEYEDAEMLAKMYTTLVGAHATLVGAYATARAGRVDS